MFEEQDIVATILRAKFQNDGKIVYNLWAYADVIKW